jgi:hypothetical protein
MNKEKNQEYRAAGERAKRGNPEAYMMGTLVIEVSTTKPRRPAGSGLGGLEEMVMTFMDPLAAQGKSLAGDGYVLLGVAHLRTGISGEASRSTPAGLVEEWILIASASFSISEALQAILVFGLISPAGEEPMVNLDILVSAAQVALFQVITRGAIYDRLYARISEGKRFQNTGSPRGLLISGSISRLTALFRVSLIFSLAYMILDVVGLDTSLGLMGFILVKGGALLLLHLAVLIGVAGISLLHFTELQRQEAHPQGHKSR